MITKKYIYIIEEINLCSGEIPLLPQDTYDK